jgi:hypothetical protein
MIPLVVAVVGLLARPTATQGGGSIANLSCFQDLSGRWEVRLTSPGYQRLTMFTWNYDSAFSPTAIGWQPAMAYWWGGPERVWSWRLPQNPDRRWLGPYTDARVLYGTHNTGTIFVTEYQWNGQAWEAYNHQCVLTQWVPSIPYGFSWPTFQ